jgi:hypothetical protein
MLGLAAISDRTKDDPAKRVTLECDAQRGGCGWRAFELKVRNILPQSQQVEPVENVG